MHTTKLRRVGGSVMLSIPPALLNTLGLRAGLRVDVGVENSRLVIAPTARPKYTLEELIEQCEPTNQINDEDRLWLDAKPIGRELI